MTLAVFDFLSRNDWFLISLFLLVISYLLYRPRRISARSQRNSYTLKGIRETYDETAREATRAANRAEVKLFDYEREVEGRMQTRLAVLDQLILESERKIETLKRVLEQSRNEAPQLAEGRTRGEIQYVEHPSEETSRDSSRYRADAA